MRITGNDKARMNNSFLLISNSEIVADLIIIAGLVATRIKIKQATNRKTDNRNNTKLTTLISLFLSPKAKYSAENFCPAEINPRSAYEKNIVKLTQILYIPNILGSEDSFGITKNMDAKPVINPNIFVK